MIQAKAVLMAAAMLVGFLFMVAVGKAARAEFPNSPRRWWTSFIASALVFLVILTFNAGLALSGVLGRFDSFPSPIMPFFAINILGVSFAIAFSPLGTLIAKHTSFAALTGFQSFRILAELVIFLALKEGLAPVQMSFEGWNFDIVTGVTAVVLGFYLRNHEPRLGLVRAWNLMGMGFLLVIAFIAMTSMPTPMRLFMNEPSNVWVTTFPYVFLPSVLVVAALTGHLISLRKLARL